MRCLLLILVGLATLSESASLIAQERTPWTASRIQGTPEPPPQYRAAEAYPKLKFDRPTVLTTIPNSNRLVLAEQHGRLYSFPDDSTVEKADLFIDLKQELTSIPDDGTTNGVGAVYGVAFHPRYPEVPDVFICYTLIPKNRQLNPLLDGTRVSRFPVQRTDPPTVDASREEILITWREGGHNGGCLKFGPDGYLYITTGDAAPPNPPDPLKAGQDVSNLLSSILRIDVDRKSPNLPYGVPADNPFVSLANARPEIWSYGFRNPWKMSFDRETGNLWVGDVGWELWEMVYRVEKGGNYGWSITEGPQPVHPDDVPGPTPILPPAIALPHSKSSSVTGGFVYRGSQFPELVGRYLFGDYDTRKIWAADFQEGRLQSMETLTPPQHRVVAFAEKHDGEILILDYSEGTIHQLIANKSQKDRVEFPRKLSETGLFADTANQIPEAGVYAFEINAPMWMDGATAERWVALPNDSRVKWYPRKEPIPGLPGRAQLHYPENAVLAKTISLETTTGHRKIETQILHHDGRFWHAYSYRWNEAQTDAMLVPADGEMTEISIPDVAAPEKNSRLRWTFQSRNQCLRCHNRWDEYGLAFSLPQLNRSTETVGSQLEWLQQLILLEKVSSGRGQHDPGPPFANVDDDSADLTTKARSYLHVNCAHCHQNGAGGTATINLLHDLTLEQMQLIGATPRQGDFGIENAMLVAPGDPYRSVLLYRMAISGSGHMPHIGSERIDHGGVSLLSDWISSIDPGWKEQEIWDQLISQQNPKSKQFETLVEQLLDTPNGTLYLATKMAVLKHSQPDLAARVIDLVLEHSDPRPRKLLASFLPSSARQPTLGTVIEPEYLLSLKGDAEAGEKLFWNTRVMQCARCHKVGDRGGEIGPALHDVAKRLKPNELVESLLAPSRKIAEKYQTWSVVTDEGQVMSGLIMERTDDRITLTDAQGKTHRLRTDQIETLQPQKVSLMPDQLLRDLTASQAADLLAYLMSLQ
ncbi:MAG: PQQ-dependent sugar dehydrogenase [Planctomycetaceae bacterium]|nr:PQQ-dependent sugar dehydrogenase [Planctomycetaceae bacterium]